ncbi:DUF4304 domain-containing protein [Epilithonimonas hispanica]|uniref:DUF4304 domain-containing protein n=1 Tax=Epilithonimonas hispanica TaxID=358687 RepID=A0A3D9D4U3_9FLAO|nr:DUF4304 domain-containing protein [Epilithonimonas hispanica]REC72968.1 hypothetical protein DRF58_01030 [Epilithonimonas hispanica]
MITSADFKKHISKTLSQSLKELGFKGSGFSYRKESDNFIFIIGIQASQYGGKCCVEIGIHPKEMTDLFGSEINFKTLKYYECEFRTRVTKIQIKKWWNFSNKNYANQWWDYSNSEKTNIKTAENIILSIKNEAVPIIEAFQNEDYILDNLEISDLSNPTKKLAGLNVIGTEVRLIWALSKIYEKRNLKKAFEYAKLGISKLETNDKFLGKIDFENIIFNYTNKSN